jgi:transcription elongation factor Elf1
MASYSPFALRADPTRPVKQEAFRADLNVRLVCPDCQNENVQLVEEFGSGDLVCGECGEYHRQSRDPGEEGRVRVERALMSRVVFARRARAGRQDRRHEE